MKNDEKVKDEQRCEKCTGMMMKMNDSDDEEITFCPSCGFYFRLEGWDGNYVLIKDTMKIMTEKQYEDR